MANSTDTYWSVNGVSIQTLAYNIVSWGDSLQAPPSLRGSDLTIPYRPGQIIQPRRPDSRSLTFTMWVVGADTDGRVPTSATMRAEFEKNLKMLRSLFWNQGKPVTLTRRWKDYGSNTVQTATATAIYEDGFVPTMNGAQRATFSVTMRLPDPFFYGAAQTVSFAATATSSQTVVVPGDYETTAITLTTNSPRNIFTWSNTFGSATNSVTLTTNLSSGSVVLDVDAWTARNGSTNVSRDLTWAGHTQWFALQPGTQTVTLTSSTGAGSGSMTFKPRWL